MNQGKLEVVKQKMARVKTDILGIFSPLLSKLVNCSLTVTIICHCFSQVKQDDYALVDIQFSTSL